MNRIIKYSISVSALALLSVFYATANAAIPTKSITPLFTLTKANNDVLSKPSDVAVNDDYIYVVDGDNHRIVIYNKKGQYVSHFGKFGARKAEFNYPVGIGLDSDGNVYVADTKNHRVQIFDEDGGYEKTIKISIGNEAIRPVDVAVSKDKKKIFVTTKANKVLVYTQRGKKIKEIGKTGKERGEFRFPGTIAMLSHGRIGVIDVLNFRLQVFSAKGKVSYQVGDFGVRPGLFIRPKGVAIAPDRKIYISDSYMDLIQVFSDKGRFLYVLGNNGKPHKVIAPGGMAIDKQRRLYVSEIFENRISVYKLD